ncbi:MAG: TetR/AcrR family transcriptional regulator [Marinibacterium sp.]
MPDTDRKPHHHGNLRAALIEAGVALLEEGGPRALTLRNCARRAGVSHAAPAHHFKGLQGLKSAIAQEGFRRFSKAMLDATQSGEPTPRGRLRAICRGYLKFGLDHPALLELMFGLPIEDAAGFDLQGVDSGAYDILRDTCAPFVPDGMAPEIIELQVWSLIHGYTLLFLSGRLGRQDPAGIQDAPFEQVMGLLDRVGRDPVP